MAFSFKSLFSRKPKADRPLVVTFTGGMGAQIISAAVYFSYKDAQRPVFADLSYFDEPERVAKEGTPGDCSHWSWQLEAFGLTPDSFLPAPFPRRKKEFVMLNDGPEKLSLGLNGLSDASVRKRFNIDLNLDNLLPDGFSASYLCIHIRRGDYVNVATHLVPDDAFVDLAKKFSGLITRLAVISDSPIGAELRQSLSGLFEESVFLDQIDAFESHRVMRGARILICSNSQFSLVAAALNPDAMVLIPSKWFGEENNQIESSLRSICRFQLFTH